MPAAWRAALPWLGAFLLAVWWHLLLPSDIYRSFPVGVYLEGPFPALLGAAVGRWWHRHEPPRLRALGVAAGAAVGLLLAILLLGPLFIGLSAPFKGLGGVWSILPGRAFMLLAHGELWSDPRRLWVWPLWLAVKSVLFWALLAYLVMLALRHDARAKLRWLWRDLTQNHAFRREQRRLHREYRHLYLEALKAGQAPPAPPPGYVPGAGAGDGWADNAKGLFWLVRIVLLFVGGISFWAIFGDYLVQIMQRLTGPLPWWMGIGQ